jgi:hypothetical protein
MSDMDERGMVGHVGPIEIDVPRTLGYYAGIGLAVAYGMIEPPVGVFIALVPFFKMLNRPNSTPPERFTAQVLDGASKPVGGDSEAAIRWQRSPGSGGGHGALGTLLALPAREARSIWQDARAVAKNGARSG